MLAAGGGIRRRRRRRRCPGSEPDPADLSGARRVPPLREGLELLHLIHALLGAHPRHAPPNPGGVISGDGVEHRLPPILPRLRRVAELDGSVAVLSPAPPALQAGDVPLGALADACGAAWPTLGAAERAGAGHGRDGDAVPGDRRERVLAVAEDAERQAALARGHARHRQLRRERRLRVEPRVARGGELREHGQPGQRGRRGVTAAVA